LKVEFDLEEGNNNKADISKEDIKQISNTFQSITKLNFKKILIELNIKRHESDFVIY